MNDWAKTIIGKVLQIHFDLFTYCTKVSHLDRVIAGRARICGIPIGIISSELRNVMSVNPADPACPNSQSVEVHQAGQVWYPDSAFKTAEVIGDFNREGLPLLFIASLRGFSGGQRGALLSCAVALLRECIAFVELCRHVRDGAEVWCSHCRCSSTIPETSDHLHSLPWRASRRCLGGSRQQDKSWIYYYGG